MMRETRPKDNETEEQYAARCVQDVLRNVREEQKLLHPPKPKSNKRYQKYLKQKAKESERKEKEANHKRLLSFRMKKED